MREIKEGGEGEGKVVWGREGGREGGRAGRREGARKGVCE